MKKSEWLDLSRRGKGADWRRRRKSGLELAERGGGGGMKDRLGEWSGGGGIGVAGNKMGI